MKQTLMLHASYTVATLEAHGARYLRFATFAFLVAFLATFFAVAFFAGVFFAFFLTADFFGAATFFAATVVVLSAVFEAALRPNLPPFFSGVASARATHSSKVRLLGSLSFGIFTFFLPAFI